MPMRVIEFEAPPKIPGKIRELMEKLSKQLLAEVEKYTDFSANEALKWSTRVFPISKSEPPSMAIRAEKIDKGGRVVASCDKNCVFLDDELVISIITKNEVFDVSEMPKAAMEIAAELNIGTAPQ